MADCLHECLAMTRKVLSEADFEGAFPHVFGHPTYDYPEVAVRNECGLLLRKAQVHLVAVLQANENNNMHSLALQLKVILECAAQLVSKAYAAYEGTPDALGRVLNRSEYDFVDAMARLSRGALDRDDIHSMIVTARIGIGDDSLTRPKRVLLSDAPKVLPHGSEWYRHLSRCFSHSGQQELADVSSGGGVLSVNTKADHLAFARLMDYAGELVAGMLIAYGFLLIAVTGESQTFEDGLDLLQRRRSTSKTFREAQSASP